MDANAGTLWLDVGAMQGGARNQVEFPDEIALYFGNVVRHTEMATIQLAPGVLHFRPFVYRGDDYGHYTDRWRLCLPTNDMGGPDYSDRIVRFDKVQLGGVLAFQITVTDRNSAAHKAWKSQSQASGGVNATRGGREYGWF
jgi:hypothetical protein